MEAQQLLIYPLNIASTNQKKGLEFLKAACDTHDLPKNKVYLSCLIAALQETYKEKDERNSVFSYLKIHQSGKHTFTHHHAGEQPEV